MHGKTEACRKEILTEIRLQEPLRQNYMMLLDFDLDAEGTLHCGESCSTQPFCPFHSACGRAVSLRASTIHQGDTHHKHDCSSCKAMTGMGDCENYAPFLGSLNIRCRIIIGIQNGTIILTTIHMVLHPWTTRGHLAAQLRQRKRRALDDRFRPEFLATAVGCACRTRCNPTAKASKTQ